MQIPVMTSEFPAGTTVSDEDTSISMPLAWVFVFVWGFWLGFYPANCSYLI